jgi:hypothetical protein
MAMPDVRAFAIYINHKKAFTCNQQSISIPMGRTAVFGQEGYLAHSKGAVQVRLQLNEITPVGGSDLTQLLDKSLKQENVDIAMFVGGKQMSASFAVTNIEFSSQTESGVATGSGTFEGGLILKGDGGLKIQ